MNPNQEQSCFGSSGNNEGASMPEGSRLHYDSLASQAEVQKDSLPLVRLGDSQTGPQFYSPSHLLKGQSSTFLTHPVDDHCPPISQFQESNYQLPEHSFDGRIWDINHMPQGRLQYIAKSTWPYPHDLSPEELDDFLYIQQSLEGDFFSSQQQEEIHLPPLQIPEVNIPPCKDSRDRLQCFVNITNKTRPHFHTVSSEAGSSVHWTDSDVNKMPVKIFSGSDISYQFFTSTVDHGSNCTEKLSCSSNVTNQDKVDSPMFSEAGSTENSTSSNVHLAKNIEKMIDHLTKITLSGSPTTSTDPNVDPPMMTSHAGVPEHLIGPPTGTHQAGSQVGLFAPPILTSRISSPVHLISPNVNQRRDLGNPLKSFFYKTELCRNFLAGNCELGVGCQFAHGPDDLRYVEKHPRYKKKICMYFYKYGKCRYARRCVYAHVPNPTSSQPTSQNLGSDGETSPRSSYSSSPPNRKLLNLGAFIVKKRY